MGKYLDLIEGINSIQYGTDDFHRFISKDENIGVNCENLTIVVLSLNRVEATIKLLKTLEKHCKQFSGKVIICDNGSDKKNLVKLKKAIDLLKIECKLIEFNENYGVARGRNEAVKYVDTDWIMFLDNDRYFIKDIFLETQKAIAQLGCKFMNLPLLDSDAEILFSYGGHIYVTVADDKLYIGCGSTYKQNNVNDLEFVTNVLATFLFGGSSIVNKKAFLNIGGFDEGMFIGFEDIDLSIRIFNEGYKIGCSKAIGLVHEHVKSQEKADQDYEKKRYSYDRLLESAKYFEKKNGFKVWTDSTEQWLKEQEKKMGIERKVESKNNIVNKKIKIALIVDVKDWALDNIAKNIKKYLGEKYDIDIIYMEDIPDQNIARLFYACMDYDVIHFLWRGFLNFIEDKYFKSYLEYYGRGKEAFIEEIIKKHTITCSVYDYRFIEDDIDITKNIFKYVKYYTVSSRKLFDIYNNLDIIKPTREITDGVDIEKFRPNNLDRFMNTEKDKLIVGWVGNSKYFGDKDHKGINTIIKPAINELISEGNNIELKLVDKAENYISHDEMPRFYEDIDVYICASINEGTPNPILEAMSCGVPVITTDVGIVSEVLGPEQKKYILEERSKECLKNKLKNILNDSSVLQKLSNENINMIKKWSWKNKTEEFDEFFQYVIKNIK